MVPQNNSKSNIKDHWSQITITNINNNDKVQNIARIAKLWHTRHKVSKFFWENGVKRLNQLKVAANLHFVKNAVSAEHNKVQ